MNTLPPQVLYLIPFLTPSIGLNLILASICILTIENTENETDHVLFLGLSLLFSAILKHPKLVFWGYLFIYFPMEALYYVTVLLISRIPLKSFFLY